MDHRCPSRRVEPVCHACGVVEVLVTLAAVLVTAAVTGGVASARGHAAYREALRELRDGERRLEPGAAGTPRRLVDELRWYADVAAATRDSGWRLAAGMVALLGVAGLVLGIWALADGVPALDAAAVVILLGALLLVVLLVVADGMRSDRRLVAAVQRSPLRPVRRLEDAVAAVHLATGRARRAHRAWLRTRAAGYPLSSVLARRRRRTHRRAVARRERAVQRLRRAVPVDLETVAVRPPDGYADGLRGLSPLLSGAVSDDGRWAAAVGDLNRAAERDAARRTRWLSALAACAELRDDPPARESAARWALDAAALGEPGTPGGPRTDPLPDAVAVEPVRPATWEGALRRARTVGVAPGLLAEVTLRWAYALVSAGAGLDAAVTGGAEVMAELAEPEDYLRLVRPGLEQLGASSPQLSRLVPQWTGSTAAPVAP